MIKITNVGDKLNEFIRKNAKRIVCTSIAAIMMGIPMHAKGDKNINKKDYLNRNMLEETINHNEIILKNASTEKNLSIDLNKIDSNNMEEYVQSFKNEVESLIDADYEFGIYKYYSSCDKCHRRKVYTFTFNNDYFANNSYEAFFEDLKNGRINDMIVIINEETEYSDDSKNFDLAYLEDLNNNVTMSYNMSHLTTAEIITLCCPIVFFGGMAIGIFGIGMKK